jgi:predicted ATP-grasp superfamily ATP-dependent carboligase
VIGTGCGDVVRALALAEVSSAVIAPRHDGSQHSRFARRILDWDWDLPIEQCGEQLLGHLLEFGRRQSDPPVLFPCSDRAVVFASRYRTQLQPTFRLVVASPDLVEDLSDKQRFSALSERLSLPVPATHVVESAEELGDVDVQGFPLIVKPALRGRTWGATEAAKAIRVDNVAELRDLARRLRGADEPFVVQECVEGPESAVESYHVYVDGGGLVRGEFTGRKIRTHPAEFGHSTALTLTGAADVQALGRRLVDDIGLRGVAKFDFKRSPQGDLYLLEINPRFNLWHHLGARRGVNLPAIAYADLIGDRRITSPTGRATSGTWVHPKDVIAARRAGVPLLRWLSWASRCDAKASWAWNDPLPLFAAGGARLWKRAPAPRGELSSRNGAPG